jgi:hypothetical protein
MLEGETLQRQQIGDHNAYCYIIVLIIIFNELQMINQSGRRWKITMSASISQDFQEEDDDTGGRWGSTHLNSW